MLVQVRDGSIVHNLDTLLPLLARDELGDNWTLVTDDILPDDLRQWGHIDGLLRRGGRRRPGHQSRPASVAGPGPALRPRRPWCRRHRLPRHRGGR